MPRQVTLGIDIGSSSTKAVLLEPGVGLLAAASRPAELASRHSGWAEGDPRQWWDNVCELVPQLLASSDLAADRVVAVACAGMVPAVMTLDSAGEPLGPAILQNDARATSEIEQLRAELETLDLLALTGSALTQQSVAPTIRWLQKHEPEQWAATTAVVGSYDWLAMALGTRAHVEENWAIESGLFDLRCRPVEDVWEALGSTAAHAPEPVRPGTVLGEVTARAAEQTGLRPGTPIVVGGADHVLSAYGAGLARPGEWLVKLGGAGDILAVNDRPVPDARLYLDTHPVPGLWLPNGCMATSGSLLRWLQHLVGDVPLETLDSEAAREAPAALVCLPYFLGEKSPHHDPDLRGTFAGLHLGSTRGAMHRAALEAIAFGVREHVAILQEIGLPLDRPRVTNGGSASSLWKQILADVLQRPMVPVIDHPGASLGAAIAAAIGVGAAPSWDVVHDVVHTADPIEPDSATTGRYDEAFETYRRLHDAVRPISHTIARTSRA